MTVELSTQLEFVVPLTDLISYYNTLTEKYQHLNWNWEKCGSDIVKQWRDEAYKDPANLLTNGWAIQSNLEDLSIPCPPWNISTHKIVEYRNTELVFGIIERLQTAIPFGYRWAVSVQPPGGKVSLHSDQTDEVTVWIPIITNESPAITFVEDSEETGIILSATGSAYLFNTTVPHYTSNTGSTIRATIIFRLNKKHIIELKAITKI